MNLELEAKNDTGAVLRTLKKYALVTPPNEYIIFEPDPRIGVDIIIQRKLLHKLEKEGAIKIGHTTTLGMSATMLEPMGIKPQKYYIELGGKFDEIYNKYSKYTSDVPVAFKGINIFTVSLRDREVRVNEFVLSRPHAVGQYMDLMEHIMSSRNGVVNREDLPKLLRNRLERTKFTSALHELGFKGDILKAFFPQRSRDSLTFRRVVTREELEKEGKSAEVLLQALRLAHIKKNPK